MKMIYRKSDGKGVNSALLVKVDGQLLEHKIVDEDAKTPEGWATHEDIVSGKSNTKATSKTKRAHKKDGKFKADDPTTPEVNEAYEQ